MSISRDPQLEKFWRKAVAGWNKSRLSVRAYCAQLNLREANFYAWRRELAERDRTKAAAVKFVPVHVRAEAVVEVALPDGIVVRVPADLAVCPTCARDVLDPENRRYQHAFASCTECGPRYSIVRRLPYERCDTSMADYAMCPACATEYAAPGDRRFHAETIACRECGPRVSTAPELTSIMTPPLALLARQPPGVSVAPSAVT